MLSMTAAKPTGRRRLTRATKPSIFRQRNDSKRSSRTSGTTCMIKADRQPGKHTKQRKKDLIQQCTKPWQEPHHRWAPQRSGYACTTCGTRMHQGLTAQQLEERLAEPCTQQIAESACPDPGQEAPKPAKKLTRVQIIRDILQTQQPRNG